MSIELFKSILAVVATTVLASCYEEAVSQTMLSTELNQTARLLPSSAPECGLEHRVKNNRNYQLVADLNNCNLVYVFPPPQGHASLSRYRSMPDNANCGMLFELQEQSEAKLRETYEVRLKRQLAWDKFYENLLQHHIVLQQYRHACNDIEEPSIDYHMRQELFTKKARLQANYDEILHSVEQCFMILDPIQSEACHLEQEHLLNEIDMEIARLETRISHFQRLSPRAMRWCFKNRETKQQHWQETEGYFSSYLEIEDSLIRKRRDQLVDYRTLAQKIGGEAEFSYEVKWQEAIQELEAQNPSSITFEKLPVSNLRIHTPYRLSSNEQEYLTILPALLGFSVEASSLAGPLTTTIELSLAATCSLRLGETPKAFPVVATYLYTDFNDTSKTQAEYNLAEVYHGIATYIGEAGIITHAELQELLNRWQDLGGVRIRGSTSAPREHEVMGKALYKTLLTKVLAHLAEPIMVRSLTEPNEFNPLHDGSLCNNMTMQTLGDQKTFGSCPSGYLLSANKDTIEKFIEAHGEDVSVPPGAILPQWRVGKILF